MQSTVPIIVKTRINLLISRYSKTANCPLILSTMMAPQVIDTYDVNNYISFRRIVEEINLLIFKCNNKYKNISIFDYSKPTTTQLDLRGKRVDDGIESLIYFLDGALVSGLQSVNILHGKGSGAMQKAVREYLKNQSFVTDFDYAHPDAGGTGITEVTLK